MISPTTLRNQEKEQIKAKVEFTGDLVVKTQLPRQGARFSSWSGELRFCKLYKLPKKKKKKKRGRKKKE